MHSASNWSAPSRAYVTLMPLSSGGMGSVEVAVREEPGFTRVVAIKRLHPHLLDEESFVAMFVDEARLAAMIRHANVVGVLDVGTDARGPYFVMDYVEGISLSKVVQRHGQRGELLPLQVCLRIAKHVCDGLHAAHELRAPDGSALDLVHRDVSPQNVLVGFDGVARVLDFGIAKALGRIAKTASGTLKGKFGYMSPEQLRYENVDRGSDLFAVGVLLHEMLTGTRLYDGESYLAARRILTEPPPDASEARSDIPAALVELSFELLAKDRAQRPATALDVSRRLDAMISECVADEGSLELTEYVRRIFAVEIEQKRVELETALQERSRVVARPAPRVASDRPTIVEQQSPAPRRTRATLAIAVGLGAVLLGFTAWATRTTSPPLVLTAEAPAAAAATALVAALPASTAAPLAAPSATERPHRKERAPVRPAASSKIPVWKW